jgi:IclR family transcriptional regulator, KDG regulon repressor
MAGTRTVALHIGAVAPTGGEESVTTESENSYSVRSLARGLGILRCFTVERPEWGVTELSKHLGLNKATIFRLVKTLEAEGFLAVDPSSGKYYVGSALLRAAYVGFSRSALVRIAQPHIERLASESGESVDLTVWTDEGTLVVAQVRTSRPFRPVSRVGRVFTDFSNSHSKVFLAFMSEDDRAPILAQRQEPRTQYSITDPERLSEEMRKVAAQGVAYDFQENSEGVCSVAAPVCDPAGNVRASLSIVAPVSRFGPIEVARLTESVKEAAAAISRDLGY